MYHEADCRHVSVDKYGDGPQNAARQSELIKIAEKVLQNYYTRLSLEPSSLTSCYLDDAELIYTGRQLNVDAVYSTGKIEIEEFFKSSTAAKFRDARFMVEALHPQASSSSPLGLVLFAKGRVWLCKDPITKTFFDTPYVHFLTVGPPSKASSFGTAPDLFIANEYLHLLNFESLSVKEPPSTSTLSSEAVVNYEQQNPPTKWDPIPTVDKKVDVPNSKPPPPPRVEKQPQAARFNGRRQMHNDYNQRDSRNDHCQQNNRNDHQNRGDNTTSRNESRLDNRGDKKVNEYQHVEMPACSDYNSHQQRADPPRPAHDPPYRDQKTLYACPGLSADVPDMLIIGQINEYIRGLGGNGSCKSVNRPKQYNDSRQSPFFFIQLDSLETFHLLIKARSIKINGETINVSPSIENRRPYNHASRSGYYYNRQRPFLPQTRATSTTSPTNNVKARPYYINRPPRQQQQQQQHFAPNPRLRDIDATTSTNHDENK